MLMEIKPGTTGEKFPARLTLTAEFVSAQEFG